MSDDARRLARRLVRDHGTTVAESAGITLRDKPSPLWQLLVMTLLLSAPIGADQAVSTVREVWKAGWRTPDRLRRSTWQQRVDALGAGGYRRYDESTATELDALAQDVTERWKGDLRHLHVEASGDPDHAARLLQEFGGIGPTGAAIFLREVQGVWPDLRPYADALALRGARAAGLGDEPSALAELVEPRDFHRLVAACVRVARDPGVLDGAQDVTRDTG